MKPAEYAVLFKSFSEPVRLRILYLLLECKELCVCELVEALSLSQSVVSRHLAYLRNAGVLKARRDGLWMYYQLEEGAGFIKVLLSAFKTHACDDSEFQQDLLRLQAVGPGSCA